MELSKDEKLVIDYMRKGAKVELSFYNDGISREEAFKLCEKVGKPKEYNSKTYALHSWLKASKKGIAVSAFYDRVE